MNGAVVLACLWTFLVDQPQGDFGTPSAVLSLFILWPTVGIAWLVWVLLSLRAYRQEVGLRPVASWALAPTLLVLTGALVLAMPDPLEAAADRIRARGDPRIAAVDAYHDWLDGDRLSVTLVADADHADARAVRCGLVLAAGVPRSVGIWVGTGDGRVGWTPTDRECSIPEPV